MSRLEQLRQLLAESPQDVFLNFALAMEYFKAGQYEEALVQFAEVSRLEPNYVAAYFQRANSLIAMGRVEEAKLDLEKGVAVARQTGDAHAASEMTDLLENLE